MTNPLIRLVFGVQILDSKPTRLVVTGSLGSSPPPLTGLRRSDSWTFSESYASDAWTADLDAGDYLVRIETDSWTAAGLTIDAELDTGQDQPRFVFWGILPETEKEGLASWHTTRLVVDPPTTSTTSNPKDPWPPPPPPAQRTAVSPSGALTWFTNQLAPLFAQSSTDQRAGAPGSGGPPPPRRR